MLWVWGLCGTSGGLLRRPNRLGCNNIVGIKDHCFFVMLAIQPRALHMLDKRSINWATSPAHGLFLIVLEMVIWLSFSGWDSGEVTNLHTINSPICMQLMSLPLDAHISDKFAYDPWNREPKCFIYQEKIYTSWVSLIKMLRTRSVFDFVFFKKFGIYAYM
jgi:hypothetical protein